MNKLISKILKLDLPSQLLSARRAELKDQHWNRAKSQLLANHDDIELTDAHWAVLCNLRKRYLNNGLPRHARNLAKSMVQDFITNGGNKYLRVLFPGGVVTQGSRFANVPKPPDAVDASYGTSY